MNPSKIEKEAIDKINSVEDLKELENVRLNYLGKKGFISNEMKNLASLSIEEKKEVGKKLNILKNSILKKIESRKISIRNSLINKKILEEKIDLSLPSRNYNCGKIHPISQTIDKVINIFSTMGFQKK